MDMFDSILQSAKELKDKVLRKTELEILLDEATNSDNWNVPNSKLQQIADYSNDWNQYSVIMKHLWEVIAYDSKYYTQVGRAFR